METIKDVFNYFKNSGFAPIRDNSKYPLVSVSFCNNGAYVFKEKEHIFLTGSNFELVQDMIPIRGTTVINEKGKEVLRKKFLLGVQSCTIDKIKLRKTKKDSLYIVIDFVRKSTSINGSRLNFAPLTERFFNIDNPDNKSFKLIQELLQNLGSDLSPKPANFNSNDYVTAVARRIRANANKSIKLAVYYSKELIRNDYGELDMKQGFSGYSYFEAPTVAFKEEILYFGDKEFDWSKAIKPLNKRDKNDFKTCLK